MTLHLTVLTPGFVQQVSDRRVTKNGTVQFDRLANKNVVLLARDGILTIGYTGVAYLQGVPTDTWISCKLAGENTDAYKAGTGQAVWTGKRSNGRWPSIREAVELVRLESDAAFSKLHPKLVDEHQVVFAGWQQWRNEFRPVVYWIENSKSALRSFKQKSAPRDWQQEMFIPILLSLNPEGHLTKEELGRLVQLLAADPTSALDLSVKAIRYASRRNPAVGPDCMSIYLPNPSVAQQCHVKFQPKVEERAYVGTAQKKQEVPAAYSPWFVGPQVFAPPAVLVGGMIPFGLGPYRLVGYAPPVKGLGAFALQDRPVDPNLRAE